MNKSELTKAIKDITRAQSIIENEIADATGEDRKQLQNIDDRLDELITEIEYIML